MGKYIVDIASPNVRNEYIVYWTYDGLEAKRVSDLTPYTAPDLEHVRKEAYQQGLSDAWDAARKVTQVRKYGGYGDCLEEVFGRHRVPWDVFDYSASEAIEKIRQYEQEKEMDGLRQNIQTIVDQCGYTIDEIAEVLQKMKES